jgi:hypothetical protein
MKKVIRGFIVVMVFDLMLVGCSDNDVNSNPSNLDQDVIDVAETSGQLASGTSFRISGSSTDSTENHGPGSDHGPRHHDRHMGILDGVNLLAPTDELLAVVDAESASDFRGMRISQNGGATITHYNASGAAVILSTPKKGGPNGCSFSGKQFPVYDSLLSTIVKTVIDFGSGVTFKHDTVTITRSGKIVINRSGSSTSKTEVTTFDNYKVNGIKIEGTKTRVSTFDSSTGSGTSTTSVSGGKIIFTDGTVATWVGNRSRVSSITLNSSGKPISGTITTEVNTAVTASDGQIIYAHHTASPLIENLACEGRRAGPVSGTLQTIYREDTVVVDYGNGSCTNRTITITVNGVTITKTIGV